MAGVRNALLIAAILAAPWIAEAAAPENWRALVIYLVKLMNSGIATLILLAFVVYFYGIASNILRFDESGKESKDRKGLRNAYFVWGITILFVMVSVFGILRIVENTLFGSTTATPTTKGIILR